MPCSSDRVMRRRLLIAIGRVSGGVGCDCRCGCCRPGREPPPMRSRRLTRRRSGRFERRRAEQATNRRAAAGVASGSPSDTASADLASNPPDPSGTLSGPIVRCRYLDDPARGTTAKFDCVLRRRRGGQGQVRTHRRDPGGNRRQPPADRAGLRRRSDVPRAAPALLRLRANARSTPTGCSTRCTRASCSVRSIPTDATPTSNGPSVERHFGGAADRGRPDGRAGPGSSSIRSIPRSARTGAERDALRLAAMLLAHWDNKASNQRLVCLAPAPPAPAPCPRPFALINDLGATFGPNKVDLDHWKAARRSGPTARAARVSMRQFPYSGGTFPDTDDLGGRTPAHRRVSCRRSANVRSCALFSAARFPGDERAWTAALLDKVRQIARTAHPCIRRSPSRPYPLIAIEAVST